MAHFEQRRLGHTGLDVPVLGLDCASLGNLYKAVSDEQAEGVSRTAQVEMALEWFKTSSPEDFWQVLVSARILGGDAVRFYGLDTPEGDTT